MPKVSAAKKQAVMARLALARAAQRVTRVVIATDNQQALVALLRQQDGKAVLSLVGTEAVRIHGYRWGGVCAPQATHQQCVDQTVNAPPRAAKEAKRAKQRAWLTAQK